MDRPSPLPQATHRVEVLPDVVRVSLAGEFDLANEQELTAWLIGAMRAYPGKAVEVDMHDVSFLDSSGIRVLLHAHRSAAAEGTGFRLVRASGTVREVLDLVGIYDHLTGSA